MLHFSRILLFPLEHSVPEKNILVCLQFIKTIPTRFNILKDVLNLEVGHRVKETEFCDPDFFVSAITEKNSSKMTDRFNLENVQDESMETKTNSFYIYYTFTWTSFL